MPFFTTSRPRTRRWPALLTALAAGGALFLSSCVPAPQHEGPDSAGSATAPTAQVAAEGLFADEAMAEFVEQELAWGACQDQETHGAKLECATMAAPLDYQDPGQGSIDVVLARTVPEGNSAPTRHLLTNPGGPGSSGIGFLTWAANSVFSTEMNEEFRLTSFDPRGVERSTPVDCYSDAELDDYRAEPLVDPQQLDWATELAAAQDRVEVCRENSGPIIDHLDTVSAVHDLELMRLVLAQKQLDYIGFSYGTALGARYAELFPQHVGAMVLDGGMDPALDGEQVALEQMEGFVAATKDWVQYCLDEAKDSCALTGSVDQALQQIQARLEQLDQQPVTVGGREVNGVTWLDGFIVPLYDRDMWPHLVSAFGKDAREGDPSMLLQLADLNYDRNSDGSYGSNLSEAFGAINCADYGGYKDKDELVAHFQEANEASPLFGRYFVATDLLCSAWPHQEQNRPQEVRAAGSAPILVVGTTGDPATPYAWSEALAQQLENGTLLTWHGFGHTAYGKSNCVDAAVESFLIDGTVPEDGKACKS